MITAANFILNWSHKHRDKIYTKNPDGVHYGSKSLESSTVENPLLLLAPARLFMRVYSGCILNNQLALFAFCSTGVDLIIFS